MTKEELYADFIANKYCAEAEFEAFDKVIDYTNRMVESCQRKRKEAEKARDKSGLSKDARMQLDRKRTMCLAAEKCLHDMLQFHNQNLHREKERFHHTDG